MPTKTTNTSTGQFNQGSMNTFNQFTSAGSGVLNQDIANPQSQIGFNQRIAQGNNNLFNQFARNNSNIANRGGAFGGGSSLFSQNQLNQNSRALSAGQNSNFNSNLLYADQLRQNAANTMMNYKPLQTGQTQTQSTGGIGTWLGPIASAAMGVATGGMSTAMGAAGGASSGAFGLGSQGSPMAQNSWNAYQGSVGQNNQMIGGMNTNQNYSSQWLGN